jgi:hypothetical protein
MIYEIRTYEPAEGRSERLKRRFVEQTLPLIKRHGIDVIGVFEPQEGRERLMYVTRFSDEATRTKAWAGFQNDPDWKAAKAQSEADGPLLANQTVTVLDPLIAGFALS